MKPLTGTIPRSYASFVVICPSIRGDNATSFTCVHTGAMIMNVRKSAKPMSTWFGGICCTPNACLKSASTTTIRGKHVVMINIAGASDRTVNRKSS